MRLVALTMIALSNGCLNYDALTAGGDGDFMSFAGDLTMPPGADLAGVVFVPVDLAHADWCTGSTRCPNGSTVCDGFEVPGPINSSLWNTAEYNGTLTFDFAHACRGQRAAHIHSELAGTPEITLSTKPAIANPVSVRAFVYLASPGVSGRLIRILRESVPSKYVDVRIATDRTLVFEHSLGGGSVTSAERLQLDHWHCIEAQVDAASPGNVSIRLWLDGVNLVDAALPATLLPPDTAKLGIYASPTGDLWLDELAAGSARIGCDS